MNNIKSARIAANLKQSELATMLNVGQTTISNWETGYSSPDIESLKKMAYIFKISVDDLLGNEKAPTVENDGERSVLDVSALSPENRTKLEDYLRLLLMSQGN